MTLFLQSGRYYISVFADAGQDYIAGGREYVRARLLTALFFSPTARHVIIQHVERPKNGNDNSSLSQYVRVPPRAPAGADEMTNAMRGSLDLKKKKAPWLSDLEL